MPAHFRRQRALLWEAVSTDAYGRVTRSPESVELFVRWENKFSQMADAQGNIVAVVATVVVGRDVPFGSIMWEGGREDLAASLPGTGSASATDVPLSDLMYVTAVSVSKDLYGRVTRRTLGLQRFSDTIP